MDRQQYLKQFIEENWNSLATLAWHGYLKEGRGVIVLVEEIGQSKACYFSRKKLKKVDATIYKSIGKTMNTYSTDMGFIVVYIWSEGKFFWQESHSDRLKNAEIARFKDEGFDVEFEKKQ